MINGHWQKNGIVYICTCRFYALIKHINSKNKSHRVFQQVVYAHVLQLLFKWLRSVDNYTDSRSYLRIPKLRGRLSNYILHPILDHCARQMCVYIFVRPDPRFLPWYRLRMRQNVYHPEKMIHKAPRKNDRIRY